MSNKHVFFVEAYSDDDPYTGAYPEKYWQNTGVHVRVGQLLEITASGMIGWPAPPIGPEGDVEDDYSEHSTNGDLLWERTPKVPFLKLIGRIGTNNANRFEVGSKYSEEVTAEGELYFAINDRTHYFHDNNGAFRAEISVPSEHSGCDCHTQGQNCGETSDPIALADGEKRERVTDLRIQTALGPLSFTRYYQQNKQNDTALQFMGLGWTHEHDVYLDLSNMPDQIEAWGENGSRTRFYAAGGDLYEAAPGSTLRIEVDTGSTDARYIMVTVNELNAKFDTDGRLRYYEWPTGESWVYTYDNTDLYTDKPRLLSVEDPYGNSLSFTYDNPDDEYSHDLLVSVEDHAGRRVEFSYTPEMEDGDPVETSGNHRALLTGVTDVRAQEWGYTYYGAEVGEDDARLRNWLLEAHTPTVDIDGDETPESLILLKRLHYRFQTELAVNGDMEVDGDWSDIPNLEVDINEYSTSEADSGIASRYVEADDGHGIEGQPFNLVTDRTYIITARVNCVSGQVHMRLSTATNVNDDSQNLSGWQTLEANYTHTTDPVADTRLQFLADGGAAEFYVDTVSIIEARTELAEVVQELGLLKTISSGLVGEALQEAILQFQVGGEEITRESDKSGAVTLHRFFAAIRYETENPAGSVTRLGLDGQYRPSFLQDAKGSETYQVWSSDGKHLLQTTDALGNLTEYDYNGNGTLNFRLDAEGRKTVYEYEDGNNPRLPTEIKRLDIDGTTVLHHQVFEYDDYGRAIVEQVVDPDNPSEELRETNRSYYDTGTQEGLLEQVTEVNFSGNDLTTTYFYDDVGRTIQVNHSSSFGSCTKSRTLYDAAGNVVATICNYDPEADGVTSFDDNTPPTDAAEAILLRQETLDPNLNSVTTHEYDHLGRRIKTTTEAGTAEADVTLTVYDALDRVIRTIAHFDGTGVSNPYTAARSAFDLGEDFSKNHITDTVYNIRGLVQKQIDPHEQVTLLGYNVAGQPIKTVRNASQASYDNSYEGDPTLENYTPNGEPDEDIVTSSVYDANGNLIQETDALGQVTFYGYDALNRVVKTIRSVSNLGYDIENDPTLANYEPNSVVDQDQITSSAYDPLGRLIRSKGTDGRVTLYGYDGLGRSIVVIQSASDPEYDLEADPDLSAYVVSDDADEDHVTRTVYDLEGRVLYSEDRLGHRTWQGYDGLNRVVKTIVNAQGTDTDDGTGDPRSDSYIASSDADKDLITTTRYDNEGRANRTRDVMGRYTLYGYDAFNRQVRVIRNASDPDYNITSDPSLENYVVSGESDEDLLTQTVYDDRGRVEKIIDPNNNETRYDYDSLGRQVKTTVNYEDGDYHSDFPDEDLISEVIYGEDGRIEKTIDPAGTETRYFYDKLGRGVKTIVNDADGDYHEEFPDEDLITETLYNKAGQVMAVIDVRGTKTAFDYDALGRRRSVTYGVETELEVVDYTCYSRAGWVLRTIRNWVDNETSPDEKDEWGNWLFDPGDHHEWANDHNLITEYFHDLVGRVIRTVDPIGSETLTTYDKPGQLLAITDPEGAETLQRYDEVGRLIRVVRGYLDLGEDPALWIWDDGSNEWQESDTTLIDVGADQDRNSITGMHYDKAGRRILMINPRGYATEYGYDLLDRRTSLSNAIGTWETTYDKVSGGLKVTLSDAGDAETEHLFDRVGRLKAINYLDESPKLTPDISFTYDAVGNRLSMSESEGSLLREAFYTYDAARRLVQVDFDSDGDTSIDETVTYEYEVGGLRTRVTSPGDHSIRYVYNELGQLTSLDHWGHHPKHYFYDRVGRFLFTDYSPNFRTEYVYDAAGNLRDLHHLGLDAGDGRTLARYLYEVNGRGHRTQAQAIFPSTVPFLDAFLSDDERVEYFQGDWQTSGDFEVSSDQDAAIRIPFMGKALELTLGTGPDQGKCEIWIGGDLWDTVDNYAAVADEQVIPIEAPADGFHVLIIYNLADKNPSSSDYQLSFKQLEVTETDLAIHIQHYTYDTLARLQQAASFANAAASGTPFRRYDYGYDPASNRIAQALYLNGVLDTSWVYTYNPSDQLTGDGTNTYTYDDNGNLISDGTNAYTWDRANRLLSFGGIDYAYNGLGQRVSQDNGIDVIQYLLDVQPRLPQVLASTVDSDVTRFVHEPGGIHSQQNPDDSWLWLLKDGLSTVRGIYDESLDLVESRIPDPWGVLMDGVVTQSPFYYTGMPFDANGLSYHNARYYDPVLAIFQSLDTLETPNRYGYVSGNPINLVDPSGLAPNCQIYQPCPNGGYQIRLPQIVGGSLCCYQYNRNSAVSYALTHADQNNNPNPLYTIYQSGTDTNCANFVSQALRNGNHPMAWPGGASNLDLHKEPERRKYWAVGCSDGKCDGTKAWSVAPDLATYMRTRSGLSTSDITSSSLFAKTHVLEEEMQEITRFSSTLNSQNIGIGDLLYWGNSSPEHVAMIVGWGPTEVNVKGTELEVLQGEMLSIDRWLYWSYVDDKIPALSSTWQSGFVPYVVDNGRTRQEFDQAIPLPYYLIYLDNGLGFQGPIEFIRVPNRTCVPAADYIP